MGQPIDDFTDVQTTADELIVAKINLRDEKDRNKRLMWALEKISRALGYEPGQVAIETIAELATTAVATYVKQQDQLEKDRRLINSLQEKRDEACRDRHFSIERAKRWQEDCERARKAIEQTMNVLMPHVDIAALFKRANEDDDSANVFCIVAAAQNIVAKLESPEPDLENTALSDLIRAVQLHIDNDQQVTIPSASEFADEVKLDMLGEEFWVPIDDVSEALTHGNELRAYLVDR